MKNNIVLLLFLIFSIFSYSYELNLKQNDIDSNIKKLESSISNLSGKAFVKAYKKLVSLHKKKILQNKNDATAKFNFINDDLKYGNGCYAFYLLNIMQTKDSENKLKEISYDPKWQGKTIKMKRIALSFPKIKKASKFYNVPITKKIINRPISIELKNKTIQVEKTRAGPQIKTEDNFKKVNTNQQKELLKETNLIKKENLNKIPNHSKEETTQTKSTIKEIINNKTNLKETSILNDAQNNAEIKTINKNDNISPVKKTTSSKDTQIINEDNRYFWKAVKIIQEVKVKKSNSQNWEYLKDGDNIYEGDIIKTGVKSSITLLIYGLDNKDSFSQIFENTEIKVIKLSKNNLDQLDEVYIDILLGEVLVNVENLPQQSTFKVKTPTAVAAVRGTTFSVKTLLNKISEILVLKGIVSVSMNTIGNAVIEKMIKKGEKFVNDVSSGTTNVEIPDEATIEEYQNKVNEIVSEITASVDSFSNINDSDDNSDSEPPSGPNSGDAGGNIGGDSFGGNITGNNLNIYTSINPLLNSDINIEPENSDENEEEEIANFSFEVPPSSSDPLPAPDLTPGPMGTPTIIEYVYFVDNVNGSDANSGNASAPLKTIEMAISKCDGVNLTEITLIYNSNQPYTGININCKSNTVISSSHEEPRPSAVVKGNGVDPVFVCDGALNASFNHITIDNSNGGAPGGTGILMKNYYNVQVLKGDVWCYSVIIQNCSNGVEMQNGYLEIVGDPQSDISSKSQLKNNTYGVLTAGGTVLLNDTICDGNNRAIFNPSNANAPNLRINGCEFKNHTSEVIAILGTGPASFDPESDECNANICTNNDFTSGLDVPTKFYNNSNMLFKCVSENYTAWIEVEAYNNTNVGSYLIYKKGNGLLEFESEMYDNSGTTALLYYENTNNAQLLIDGCQIYDNNFPKIFYFKGAVSASTMNVEMGNCLFYGNSVSSSIIFAENVMDFEMVHTTIYGNSNASDYALDFSSLDHSNSQIEIGNNAITNVFKGIWFANNVGDNNVVMKNNLFYNIGAGGYIAFALYGSDYDSSQIASLNSVFNANPSDDSLYSDPLFANAANGQLCPGVGSPLLNAGTTGYYEVGEEDEYVDINGNPRDTVTPDIGCYEGVGADPIISGKVIDSVTGETINNCIVVLDEKNKSNNQSVSAGNFSFNVLPGVFRLFVSKEGIFYPSKRKLSSTSGDHGDYFTVHDRINANIDLPVDTSSYLELEKTANKSTISNGEILTCALKITNPYWFAAVNDFKVVDTLPSGFKYINNSIRLDNAGTDEPIMNGKELSFHINEIKPFKSLIITYQIIPSTGLSTGTYNISAVARDVNNIMISNTSSVNVEVVQDHLFYNSTLIGRVFFDENNNGKFDKGEKGVKECNVISEYGLIIQTDKNGLFHIKNISPGRHTLKIDGKTLPEGFISNSVHGYGFETFEGNISKVNIPIIKGTNSSDNDFIFVSIGEITIRDENINGNIELVENDNSFDKNISVDGKGAYYLKGKVKGKYLIESSFDSKRLSAEYKKMNRSKIFTNLSPDKYYPIYGDASASNYRAVDTQDALYLMIEWDSSFASWGTMEVDWPQYRRTFQGGHIILKSKQQTKNNDSKRLGEIFYSLSNHQAVHEEFIGTGNSLYHLEHTPIIEGSEKIKIQFKNRFNNLTLYERILQEQIDYEIDYDNGRVILKRPLTSTVFDYNKSIISNDIASGAQAVLVIDYEYETYDVRKRDGYGVKVKNTFFDNVSVSMGYAEEERTVKPYKLGTTEINYKINKNSNILAVYSKSQESFSGGGISFDSGLTFASSEKNIKDGKDGDYYSISGNTLIKEKLKVSASYSEQDAGFSALGSFADVTSKNLISETTYAINKSSNIGVNYQDTKSETLSLTGQSISVVDKLEKANVFYDYDFGKWDFKTEYAFQNIGVVYSGTSYLGAFPPRGKELFALKCGIKPYENHYYYVSGQTTIKKDNIYDFRNDMVSLGAKIPFFEKINIQMEGSTGNIGDSILTSFIIDENNQTQSFIGFETGNHIDQGNFQKVSFAKTYLVDNNVKVKFLKDYSYYRNKILNGDVIDSEMQLNNNWSLGMSYEENSIDGSSITDSVSRNSASFRANYLIPELLKMYLKTEWRKDFKTFPNVDITHIFLESDINYKMTEELTMLLYGNTGYAEIDELDLKYFDFSKTTFGLSFRPIEYDFVNIIGKYSYINDSPLERSTQFVESTVQRKNVYTIDSIFDVFDYLDLSEKFAFRNMSEKTGNRGWFDSKTYLWINGFDIKFLETYALGLEYRILSNISVKDSKSGYLIQICKMINEWMKMTAGYNFTSFDDDLTNRDEYDKSGFFVRIEGRY